MWSWCLFLCEIPPIRSGANISIRLGGGGRGVAPWLAQRGTELNFSGWNKDNWQKSSGGVWFHDIHSRAVALL